MRQPLFALDGADDKELVTKSMSARGRFLAIKLRGLLIFQKTTVCCADEPKPHPNDTNISGIAHVWDIGPRTPNASRKAVGPKSERVELSGGAQGRRK